MAVSLYYLSISSVLSWEPQPEYQHTTQHNREERQVRTRSAQSQRGEERRGVVTGLDGEPAMTGLTELVAAWAGLGRSGREITKIQAASISQTVSHSAHFTNGDLPSFSPLLVLRGNTFIFTVVAFTDLN